MELQPTVYGTGLTQIKESSYVFTWTVEKFDSYYLKLKPKGSGKILSPDFEVLHPDGTSLTSWFVVLQLVGESQTLSAFLHLGDCQSDLENSSGLACKFWMHLGSGSNPKAYGHCGYNNFTSVGFGCGWTELVTVEKLGSDGLLAGDCLQVRVELTIFDQPQAFVTSTYTVPAEMALKPLNFESLLWASDLSDIKIYCGSKKFHAHKAILASQSEVFKRMLTSDMAEVNSGKIIVTDMTSSTCRIILRFMYTGKVNHKLDYDSLLEVIYGAEKYELNELKNYCFRKLVACVSEESVAALAVAAHLYNAEDCVKESLHKFIEPNFFRLVKKEEFKKMVEKYPDAFF